MLGGEVIVGLLLAAAFPALLDAECFTFIAELGLLVLMFEIGLDIDLERIQDDPWPSLKYGVLSFLVPFVAAGVAAFAYTGDLLTSLVIAIGLSSTALAVVIPSMNRLGIDDDLVKNAAMVSEMTGITLLMAFARSQNLGSTSIILEAGSYQTLRVTHSVRRPAVLKTHQILGKRDLHTV